MPQEGGEGRAGEPQRVGLRVTRRRIILLAWGYPSQTPHKILALSHLAFTAGGFGDARGHRTQRVHEGARLAV